MTWLHLFLALCALYGVSAVEIVSDTFPKICTFLTNTRLVGEDILTQPISNLPHASACCDACLNYKGEEGCVAYTFYYNNGATECWLKRHAVVAEFSVEGTSGFPNFYYNEAYPDLSHNLDVLFSGIWDLPQIPFRFSLQRTSDKWKFDTSLPEGALDEERFQSAMNAMNPLPSSCSKKDVRMNWAIVATNVARMPVLNLKCPEDCKKACENHREESGRYSCVAYNFKFNLPVTECWLKSDAMMPFKYIPSLGVATGKSGQTGWVLGDVPTEYQEIRDIYRELVQEGTKCIDINV